MSLRYDLALFDLDGTLTDSAPGILGTLKAALRASGLPVPGPRVLRRFIGPPLRNMLHEVYGDVTEEKTDEIVSRFRAIYDTAGVYENGVYPGIPELLEELRGRGLLLAVATSKPAYPAGLVLGRFGLAPRFDYVSAADESDASGGKEELILPVLKKSGVPPRRAVMIGDTKYDASGARKAGTDFVGALYGFGTREELEREGCLKFAASVGELRKFLIDKA